MNALQHAAAVGLLEVEHALVAEHILPVNGHQTLDVLIKARCIKGAVGLKHKGGDVIVVMVMHAR